jgi:beta-glucosidase
VTSTELCGSDLHEEDIERKVQNLLDEMTLEEKVGQLHQLNGSEQTGPAVEDVDLEAEIRDGRTGTLLNVDGFEKRESLQRIAVEESRLGIPLLFGYDVVHGYRTIFPIPLGSASSFDRDAIRRAASVAATETAAAGVHWTFAPAADVTRDARWGRAMETNGEDPYLGAELTRARVEGFQGDDLASKDTVLACAKHYAAYGGVEAGREYNTVDMSESTLRDVHLPPFESAVDAGVGTLMNAFTVHDRVPAGASEHLVRDVLKDVWEFDGFVVSDWNSFRELIYHGVATDDREAARIAIEAKSDVDMVGHVYDESLTELVKEDVVDESLVDEAVSRVLRVKFLVGLFEDPYRYFDEERRESVTRVGSHRESARELARKSIVLMENDGVLPLTDDSDLAVVGDLADSRDDVIGEWRARGRPADATSLLDGIQQRDDAPSVEYAAGYDADGAVPGTLLDEAVAVVANADVAVVTVGERWNQSGEAASRTDITLPGDQRRLLESLVETGTPVVAVLMNGRPLAVPWIAENVPAVLETWFLGTQAGHAIADVLFGDYNPSGSLPMCFPRSVGQVPVHYDSLPTGRPKEYAESGWGTSYIDSLNDPLYNFGHGLSYTIFEYRSLELSDRIVEMDESIEVSITVENTGERAGDEVVKLFTHDKVGSRSRPTAELTGFERITLDADESRTVTFTLDSDDLAFWTIDEEIAAEPGKFDVLVGRAIDDVRERSTFELVA